MFRATGAAAAQPDDYATSIAKYEEDKQRKKEVEAIFRMVDEDHDG
jgi:hypothetical protein